MAKYHPVWYIRAVMYLAGVLHTEHHASFAACDLVLRCVRFIFERAAEKSLLSPPPMAQTLTTVLSKLNLRDAFSVHPICYSCHKIFPADTSPTVHCEECEEPLFDTVDEVADEEVAPPGLLIIGPFGIFGLQLLMYPTNRIQLKKIH
ncbi:hypothetical protein R3P38DRAFT_3202925 [Favolaschia claudopus]|uniref:Uncharacterized protein n=1 Tax=Favolaschia claudopus TaxID=2862362 RepID=A0AAW0AWY4_9AGAR